LIEIPHLRQSGKNSADIRLVVDALDLCYTKSHVDTFVIISGDSDFSPLVSKLRENAKYVIGVGVKQSTSDLLIANCDEFIFYDDLVREMQRSARRDSKEAQPVVRRSPEEDAQRRAELEERRSKAIELAVATFDALVAERGDSSKIWASMLKEAIKRRKPDFSESYYGFRAFGNLLEEAQARALLEIGRDEKSGTYVFRSNGISTRAEATAEAVAETLPLAPVEPVADADAAVAEESRPQSGAPRKGEGRRKVAEKGVKRVREPRTVKQQGVATVELAVPVTESVATDEVIPCATVEAVQVAPEAETRQDSPELPPIADARVAETPADPIAAATGAAEPVTADDGTEEAKPVKKPASRSRRPRKPKVLPEEAP
jgi:hypothetical protein